jgi:rhodanese-related sulfurtransferase
MADITVEELKERLSNGEKLNLIDVREQWEFDEFNMGGQ